MIIRPLASSLQLITQPDHAALSARIMRYWRAGNLRDSPRKDSILVAIAEHDGGWTALDETLVLDEQTGRLVDFIAVSDALKRETSWLGIERLTRDPYAAALVAQHRLHVYSRYAGQPEWQSFFADVRSARDRSLRAAGSDSLEDFLRDYGYVRLGDLASLAFCNNWPRVEPPEYGYEMMLEDTTLIVAPDPFDGASHAIAIDARVLPDAPFASIADARRALASAPIVRLTGTVRGAERRS